MKTLVLLSGGLDSAYCACDASRHGELGGCLFLRWGQPMWDRERSCSRALAESIGAPWYSLDVQVGGFEAMRTGAGAEGARVVGARNLIFLSVAASVALAHGYDAVTIGCTADDDEHYPDCRPAFIKAAADLIQGTYGVRVIAPLMHLHKADLIQTAWFHGLLTPGRTWSCYESATGEPCGTCNACRLRAAAMADPRNRRVPTQ